MMNRRRFGQGLMAAGSALVSSGAMGSDTPFPQKAITIVNPFAAGGSLDILCRMLARSLGESMGQPVVVENRPGAASVIGSQFVASARGDGYTLLAQSTNFSIAPALGAALPYDWRKDFVPVTLLGAIAQALAVPESSAVRSVPELVELAGRDPGGVSYGSLGEGSGGHVTGARFERAAGIRLTQIPFKGMSQTMAALAGGHISMAFGNLPEVLHYRKLGRVRPLALASATRSELAPEIPTMAEVGLPGVISEPWYGVLAPAGTPAHVVDRLQQGFALALGQPEIASRIRDMGIRIAASKPDEFRRMLESEYETYVKIGREANIRLN